MIGNDLLVVKEAELGSRNEMLSRVCNRSWLPPTLTVWHSLGTLENRSYQLALSVWEL